MNIEYIVELNVEYRMTQCSCVCVCVCVCAYVCVIEIDLHCIDIAITSNACGQDVD